VGVAGQSRSSSRRWGLGAGGNAWVSTQCHSPDASPSRRNGTRRLAAASAADRQKYGGRPHRLDGWCCDAAGLAHGSVRMFGSRSTGDGADGIIDPRRAALAGLDYLALGDWHGTTEISQKAWYSGTPEPDRFLENDSGFALAVSVSQSGAPAAIARHRTATYTWVDEEARVAGPSDLKAIENRVLNRANASQKLIVQLKLIGQISGSLHAEITEWSETFAAHPRISWLAVDTAELAQGSTRSTLWAMKPCVWLRAN
jgi:hypothetical protein